MRRRRRRSLRKRYGCFRLPRRHGDCAPEGCVPEARVVKAAARKEVGWLARTDPKAKEVEFSEAFDRLSPEAKRYIVLHERAHLKTGPDHNANFYDVLKKLIKANRISWEVAYELESFNCHHKN